MKNVTIYTDGACSYNPGAGGWAAVLIYRSVHKEISGGCEATTNNRMEITAAIEALSALKEPCRVDLYTDSAYLSNAYLEGWIFNWIKNDWKKADKHPVENSDLWKRLSELTRIHKVVWHKVKGHSDNEYNNRCDELARKEIKKLQKTADDDCPEINAEKTPQTSK